VEVSGGLHHRYERIAARMAIRFLAQRLDCLPCLCPQTRSENGFVPVAIIFGYRRGFGTVRPARMEFLLGTSLVQELSAGTSALTFFSAHHLQRAISRVTSRLSYGDSSSL
jgi:hypothetical protein